MKYVILRDDDTNAFTPVSCLEMLYRPFLDRGLPVNLATVPAVRTDARSASGEAEGFLFGKVSAGEGRAAPLGENAELTDYLRENRLYNIVQHGFHHDVHEFERCGRGEAVRRLTEGAKHLRDAGFAQPKAFVAPHDKFSAANYREIARRFPIVSSGWFELGRLPWTWWPRYAVRKALRRPHWRTRDGTLLLSHPGCRLSHILPLGEMLDDIRSIIARNRVSVLVTHWWEYFPNGKPHDEFISVLHETAAHLASRSDVRVLKFDDLLEGGIPLN